MNPARGIASIIIVLIVVLSLAGAGAILGYQKYFKEEPELTKEQDSKIAKLEPPSASPTDENVYSDEGTANWKTFTNEEFSYEFKYPLGWKIKKYGGTTVATDGKLRFEVHPQGADRGTYFTERKEATTLLSGLGSKRTDYLTSQNQIFFSTIKIMNYKNSGWDSGTIILDAASSPGLKFENVDPQGGQVVKGEVENFELLDQILSTFKFLD